MIFADWHPDDERLLARYVEPAAHDETLDAHLAGCAPCRRRSSALARVLEGVHEAARAEADSVFDAERLDAQRQTIRRRLGAEIYGRVLPFPSPAASRGTALFTRAAAAILLVALGGAGAIRMLQLGEPPRSAALRPAPQAADARLVPVRQRQPQTDEAVFNEIEVALAAPRTAELRALDDLTPSVVVVARR